MASSNEEKEWEISTVFDSDTSDCDTSDAKEMQIMGKKQQLRRNFEFWSILAFSCCTMTTWAGQLLTFIQGLENGGPEGLVISLFVTWTAMAAIVASLAELMSMWPTSGGQYHWSYTLSPPTLAPLLSYLCGWLSTLAWQASVASACFLGGTFLQGLLVLNYPTYVPKPWQALLLCYAVLAVALIVNTLLARWLHAVEWAVFFVYVAGFVVVLVTITVLSPHKASAHEVFQVFYNEGHWSSNGVSWFVGLQGVIFAWLGADGAIHMAEECRNASKVLPRSLMASVGINGLLGSSILLAVLFCGGDLLTAIDSPTGYPIQQIFTYASTSTAGGTGLSVILLVTDIFAVIGAIAAASRELWAFARDHGPPGSTWLSFVHKGTKLPLWSIFVTALFTMLLNLIQLGSDVALNAVVSLTVSAFMCSYILPFSLVLYRRIQAIRGKGKELPWGPWTLGRWTGILINIYALIWAVLITIFSFFPPAVSPNVVTMNWSSTVFGGIIILAVIFWMVDGKRRYHGPVRDAATGTIAAGTIEPVMGWDKA